MYNSKMIKYQDCSRTFKTNEECYIDKNYVNRNGEGYLTAKIKIRTYRIPRIGKPRLLIAWSSGGKTFQHP